MKVVVIQGPNLNMLGLREPHIYGPLKLEQIHQGMKTLASQHSVELDFYQSNIEGELVDKVQEALGVMDGIIINPAAYSHTSIALKDAISGVGLPCIEVHISNIYGREEFRKISITASACAGVITGLGAFSYQLALIGMIQILNDIKAYKASQAKT